MATENRRVAAYLPPELDKAFLAFKISAGLATEDSPNQNDSKALVQILSEFLKVSYSVTHSSDSDVMSLLSLLEQRLSDLEERVNDNQKLAEGVKEDLASTLSNVPIPVVKGQMSLLDVPEIRAEEGNIFLESVGSSLPSQEHIPAQLLEGLGREDISKRLRMHPDNITKKKKLGNDAFSAWSQSRDPDGIPWKYEDSKYVPVTED
jgi:hypothetical protein